jgi:(p)ppGpp synthase/HD superfamily hydrolase
VGENAENVSKMVEFMKNVFNKFDIDIIPSKNFIELRKLLNVTNQSHFYEKIKGISVIKSNINQEGIDYQDKNNYDLLCREFKIDAKNPQAAEQLSKKIEDINHDIEVFEAFIQEFIRNHPVININVKETQNIDLTNEHYALCSDCNPIPGDNVIGAYVGRNIIIHKTDCAVMQNIAKIYGDRVVEVRWSSDDMNITFERRIFIKGNDNKGLMLQIAKIISETNEINMKDINFSVENTGFIGEITLWVKCVADLNNIINEISNVPGIIDCYEIKTKIT